MKLLLDTQVFIWWDGEPEKLPFHHKDPFDRLLIAQAIYEDIALVSVDTHLKRYSVRIIDS